MESTVEKIGVGLSILIAGLFVYATFPALQGLIAPESPLLWESVLSSGQALSIIGVVIAVGVMLAGANRLKQARVAGTPVIPAIVWIMLFALVAAAITAFVVMIAFGATYESLMEIGAGSSAAFTVGLFMALAVWWLLNRA